MSRVCYHRAPLAKEKTRRGKTGRKRKNVQYMWETESKCFTNGFRARKRRKTTKRKEEKGKKDGHKEENGK